MQSKENDYCACKRSKQAAIAHKKLSDGAGRSAEGDEHDGKADHESERRGEQAAPRSFTLAQLLYANAREHGNVTRHQRQNTGRKKGDESRHERRENRYLHGSIISQIGS